MITGKRRKKGYTPFKRPCKKCEEMFTPTGKFNRYCDNCQEALYKKGRKEWQKKIKVPQKFKTPKGKEYNIK